MAIVAQLVRAPVCGSGGRGFESHRSPKAFKKLKAFFVPKTLLKQKKA